MRERNPIIDGLEQLLEESPMTVGEIKMFFLTLTALLDQLTDLRELHLLNTTPLDGLPAAVRQQALVILADSSNRNSPAGPAH
jgi:hypothetical protein